MSAAFVNDDVAAQGALLSTTPPQVPSVPVPDTTPHGVKANRNFHPDTAHRDLTAKEMRNRFAEISYDDFFKLMIGVEPGRVLNDTLPPNYANTDALKKPLKDLAEFPFKGPESLAYPHLVCIKARLSLGES